MQLTSLKKLGLHDSEIKVYVTLLREGSSTATELSKSTKLNRSHIYDKLAVLIERGLISYVIRNNVKYYEASNPEKLLDYLKDVRDDVTSVIPDLKNLRKVPRQETLVEMYQGREGLKTVFKDVLRERKDYYVFGEEGTFQEVLPVFLKQFLRDVKLFGMREHLLSKESKRGEILITPKNTKVRYLPDKYFSPVMTCIYGNKVAIWIWSEPLFAILIENKDVAKSFKSYFEILWEIAKK